MKKILLSLFIFFIAVSLQAENLGAEGGTASVEYVFQINLRNQVLIGFTTTPENIGWNLEAEEAAALDNVDTVALSYSSANGETTQDKELYFYYIIYQTKGSTIGFIPQAMSNGTELEPIGYTVEFSSFSVESSSDNPAGVISVGQEGTSFSYAGGVPVIHVYKLVFKLEESDFPAVMSGSYTGNIVVSYTAS